MDVYLSAGHARFYCPTLARRFKGRHHEDMTEEERIYRFDGGGHSAWDFRWEEGAYHINHPANGGVPRCKLCGKELILVKGDDPGHQRSGD